MWSTLASGGESSAQGAHTPSTSPAVCNQALFGWQTTEVLLMLHQISTLHQVTSVPQIFWSFLAKAWDKPKSMYTTCGPRADAAQASYTGPNLPHRSNEVFFGQPRVIHVTCLFHNCKTTPARRLNKDSIHVRAPHSQGLLESLSGRVPSHQRLL